MRTRKVNRYWCDFCNKGGLSARHMRAHETSCTLNPSRVCRMCVQMKRVQRPIAELRAGLPTIGRGHLYDEDGPAYNHDALQLLLPPLRERADDCPVCIMAALRQSGIPVSEIYGFKFKDECREIFNEINAERAEHESPY